MRIILSFILHGVRMEQRFLILPTREASLMCGSWIGTAGIKRN